VLGNGLLTSDGEIWRRQRKLMQPAFHRKTLLTYAEHMTRHAEHIDWADGAEIDLSREMMELTLRIVCKTLFDHDVRGETDTVASVMEALRTESAGQLTPEWMPTPGRARRRRAIARMHALIARLVDQRAREGLRDDLLSLLLDVEGGMSETQLRDEMMTLFLAGHETTSHGLTWTLYLLAQHPSAERRLADELAEVLKGRAPTIADLKSLPWTRAVVSEALRLYPPAFALARVADKATEIGGYELVAGAQVVIWIYHVHHHPAYHDDPDAFRPARHIDGTLDKRAFLPFSRGSRMCIGASFAEMEMQLLLASLTRRYRLQRIGDAPVQHSARVTLAPKGGVKMRVERRA
jgi:cytochrome P450